MKQRIQIFLTHALTLTYAIVSIFGHAFVFNQLLDSGIIDKQFSSEKKSHNTSSVPLWTQKKHFPAFQKENNQFHRGDEYYLLFFDLNTGKLMDSPATSYEQSIVSLRSRPRSPPNYSVLS
jgi:hypothetical protein